MRVSQNLAKLGGGCTAGQNFGVVVYEAFHGSTSSYLKPKTLVEGRFAGWRTV